MDRTPDAAEEPEEPRRRGIASGLLAGVLAIAGLAGLTEGLTPGAQEKGPRPISAAEADQLAQVRLHNWQDAQAGIAGTMTEKSGKQIRFDGWIDWRSPLLYIRTAHRQEMGGLLIQAVPGIVAIRTMPESQGSDSSKPPAVPPDGNWRLRELGLPVPKEPDPIDALLGLMFALTADHKDDPILLQQTDSQWVRQDSVDGAAVQVLLGPAVMPKGQRKATSRGLREHGGAVAYWVGAGGRLERLETYLSPTVIAHVDIDRTQKAEFTAVQAFGGGHATPRAVNAAEAKALAEMRRRTWDARGGRVTLTLPTAPNRLVRADGWIDFRKGVAYAIAHDVDDPQRDVLIHASATRMSLHKTTGKATPLPAPPRQWQSSGGGDLDVLLHEVLSISIDVRGLAERANRLRLDEIGDRPVTVFEIRGGEPLSRYWVDPTGLVHRVEIRTSLGFAQLDIDYGEIPTLPARV